jgi:8-oxo-dGTP pyrophosphatase MutT (NUDIX family)
MTDFMRAAWEDFFRPLFRRPRRLQVAALCCRGAGDETEVLLITSRGTGRWIIPKGWPITGLDAREAALREAWEEAGVAKGVAAGEALGSYTYDKMLDGGLALPVETLVFPVTVEEMASDFPEAHQRRRAWVRPGEAANMVREPGLRSILQGLASRPSAAGA